MENINNEHNQGATDGLESLSDKDRKETKEILDEISAGEKDAPKPEGDDAKPEEKKDEKPADDKTKEGQKSDKAEGEKKPDETGEKKPEPRRDFKLMPAWLHERAKADWEKREKELLESISKKGEALGENKAGEGKKDDTEAEIEKLAEEEGISASLAKKLIDLAAKRSGNGKIPDELKKELDLARHHREQQEIANETAQFNSDFDSQVLPIVKAEYGNDISPEIISDIREKLKELAYNPDYSKVPYTTLYKGEDKFRGVIPPIKKGAEGARGGHTAAAESKSGGEDADISKPLNDDEIRKLTDEQFETYTKNMEKLEKAQRS